MSQDTRKDPRAKIVSLNVRYKSATVDEFIDNHASDVSKGGIFIKTSTPFPQGTLLKFEIRLAGDQSVIAGVGRVVWKREPGGAGTGPDRAAGMGVKFIKLDDASRQVIDRLAASRPDSGSAFTSELENDVTQVDNKAPAGVTGASALKSTIAGVGPSAKPTIQGMPAQTAPRPAAGVKSTIVGMPAVQQPREDPKPAAGGGGFFPAGSGLEADMPPAAERTVMKQAAELLEEALKEAGGSMDEVGSNPLFEKSAPPPAALAAPTKEDLDEEKTATNDMPRPVSTPPKEKAAPTETATLPKPITQQPILSSDRAHSLSSSRPAPVSAKAFVAEPEGRKSNPLPFVALGLVIVGALGFGGYKAGLFGGSAPVDTTTPPMPTPSVTMSAPAMDSAMPMTDASLAAIPETADAGGLAAAMAAKDAGAPMPSVTATVKPPAAVYHPPVAKPKPTATATEDTSETPAPTATATATATATTTAPAPTPAPTDTATAPTPTAAPTTTATAAPTASSKPTTTKPADDNPY
jgi:uncharacterized protein (TIGR02266 family)